jgi:hypothetical protein
MTDEAIRAADGQWTFLLRDLCRNLERQLAAATEEREQMGKLAHANACEAMEYRRRLAEKDTQLAEAANVMRAATVLIAAKGRHNTMQAYNGLREALARIDERHPELAGNKEALPPSVGSGDHSTP